MPFIEPRGCEWVGVTGKNKSFSTTLMTSLSSPLHPLSASLPFAAELSTPPLPPSRVPRCPAVCSPASGRGA